MGSVKFLFILVTKKNAYVGFTENLKLEDHLEGLGVDGSIILKLLLKV